MTENENENLISEETLNKQIINEEVLQEETLKKENLHDKNNFKNLKEKPRWYVIHTYSGYENKVKANIEKIIENRNMYDFITDVIVPIQEVTEITKSGQKKLVSRKVFPGYVFLKMIMNDDTWYVVRNTRGVTSFVGPGSKPVALTEDEVISMGIESFATNFGINEGDVVLITAGPFANSTGIVKEINFNKRTLVINVNFFGRETPVEIDFNQVQQMS